MYLCAQYQAPPPDLGLPSNVLERYALILVDEEYREASGIDDLFDLILAPILIQA
jgi:hypothetical protein